MLKYIKKGIVNLGYGILITAVGVVTLAGITHGCSDWYERNFKDSNPAVEYFDSEKNSRSYNIETEGSDEFSILREYGDIKELDLEGMISQAKDEIKNLEKEVNSGFFTIDEKNKFENDFEKNGYSDLLKKAIFELTSDGFVPHPKMVPLDRIIKDVCFIESRGNPNATSYRKDSYGNSVPIAHGIMQIRYGTLPQMNRFAKENGLDPVISDPYNEKEAFKAAILYLNKSYEITNKNKMVASLIAYNSGFGTVDDMIRKYGEVRIEDIPYKETRNYVAQKLELDNMREQVKQIEQLEQTIEDYKVLKDIQVAIYKK